MSTHITDKLTEHIQFTQSVACVGLDPRVSLLPPEIITEAKASKNDPQEQVAFAFERFMNQILDLIADRCAAVKPQVACYEAYGAAGMAALERIIAHAQQLGLPVIVDGKRGDIGSTAQHYGEAWLGSAPSLDHQPITAVGADWLTVNGYLGSDGVTPMLPASPATASKGVFVLVKTSNPSSADLQDMPCGSDNVHGAMARLVDQWGAEHIGECGLSHVGAVVGATWPEQARAMRQLMPNTLFLVPGYGAQGGTAADALAGRRADGSGVIVNSSRGIIGAWQQHPETHWATAARDALDTMNADLASV